LILPIDRRFRKATTSVVRPMIPMTKRHFIIPSSINPIQASRQLRRVQRRSRCRPASKHGIVVDNRWKGRVNLDENAGILVETRLWATTRVHWMTFRTWMDRFVANSSRRRERGTMCADSRIHINPALGRADNGKGSGGARVCNGGTNSLSQAPPTPLRLTRSWMSLNRPDVAAAFTDPKWAARNTTLCMVSDLDQSRRFLYLCCSYYSRDSGHCENNATSSFNPLNRKRWTRAR